MVKGVLGFNTNCTLTHFCLWFVCGVSLLTYRTLKAFRCPVCSYLWLVRDLFCQICPGQTRTQYFCYHLLLHTLQFIARSGCHHRCRSHFFLVHSVVLPFSHLSSNVFPSTANLKRIYHQSHLILYHLCPRTS